MLLSWVVFPAVLTLVVLGCGLLVEKLSGFKVPGALLPVLGLALLIVAGDFATAFAATAQLATPLVLLLSLAGYGLSYPWRGRRLDRWALTSALGVFAVYAAPIVLSGSATFAGYISLDDTATWLALAGHVVESGRSVAGLAPSTSQQILTDYLNGGYPLGAFIPLGVGGQLTGQNLAWLFQPTIAVYGAMLALSIYAACARLVLSRRLRALVALVSAQPALLFAYAFWSGIKELCAAAMIALVCALVSSTLERWSTVRGALPAALAVAALFAILSVAGGVWLLVPAAIVAVILVRRGLIRSLRVGARLVGLVALLSLPSLVIARAFLKGASGGSITSSHEVANLGHPLNPLQVLGIWPAEDFRVRPHDSSLTHIFMVVLVVAVAAGLVLAWRRRAWAMPLYAATAVGGFCLAVVLEHLGLSSPWLNAKTMAEASPALVATGVAGVAAVFETGRRTEAAVMFVAIAVGVLWSNVLTYSNAWLAPRSQLAELQMIGERFAGDGPALMTEYQPYGVRYLLRKLDPEGASERRRRVIPLRTGVGLQTGQFADLDEFDPASLLVYRTIVLRRSPLESRPSSVYHLAWTGGWYEVWQRPRQARTVLEHLSLGTSLDPAAVPDCRAVLRLAQRAAGAGGVLATVERPSPPIVLYLSQGAHPAAWNAPGGAPGTLVTNGAGTVSLATGVPTAGRYALWLGGSFRRTVSAIVDGSDVGSVSDQLNATDQWTPLGAASLNAGSHSIALDYAGSRLAPGTGGFPFGMGPLVLSATTAELPVTYVHPSRARSLCGKRLDWLEAVGP
jgi:hypothetical protein